LRSNPLPALARPDVPFDARQLSRWCQDLQDYSRIVNTKEFQVQMRLFLIEITEKMWPSYAVRRDWREGMRHSMADQLDLRLRRLYPGIEKFGRVVYRRHGGPDAPGPRFILQPHEGSKGRNLRTVVAHYVESSRKASVHPLRLKANGRYTERWDALRHEPKSGVLFIERYSGVDGFLRTQAAHPQIRLDLVSNNELHVICSSRAKTLLAHTAVLRALERHLPAKVVFRNPDRMGREYYLATLDLFSELGIDVEFEEYVRPSSHCHPWRSEIQQDNKKLDGFLFVHISKLKGLSRRVAEYAGKIRDWYLIKQNDLSQLGVTLHAEADLCIAKFGNCLAELGRLILNNDRQIYLIHAPP
jgi:hypothetical protein